MVANFAGFDIKKAGERNLPPALLATNCLSMIYEYLLYLYLVAALHLQ